MDGQGRLGVWSTEGECYELIAERLRAGARTLETGAGLSTVLFAASGCEHFCIVPFEDEIQRLQEYCRSRAIDLTSVHFEAGRSEIVLPALGAGDLDLVLVDGNHGFPMPMIDFFYGAGRLRAGGTLVLDDVQLPAVRLVAEFCDLDPGWRRIIRTPKWGAWERQSSGPFVADHVDQPSLTDAWVPGGGPFKSNSSGSLRTPGGDCAVA